MPPQAIRAPTNMPSIEIDARRKHDGGNVLVEALGHFEGAVALMGGEQRRLDRSTNSPGSRSCLPYAMKKSSSGITRVLSPLRRTTLPPSAIRAGARSPIGDPLAMFPPTVPLARTCFEPKRRMSSLRSGWIAPSSGAASSNVHGRPKRERSISAFADSVEPGDPAEPNHALQIAQLLGDPEPNIRRPADERRVRKRA